jgi:hypothetical protein
MRNNVWSGEKMTQADISEIKGIKPSDLRKWDDTPLYVRNNRTWKVVHDDYRGGEMTLSQKGGPEPVGVLPLDVAKHPGFQKMWRRGDFTVSTDPAMEDELFLMEQRQEQLAAQRALELSGKMGENPADKDIVQATCVHCGIQYFAPAVEINRAELPPLCPDHEELTPLFTMVEKEGPEGTTTRTWHAVTIEDKKTEEGFVPSASAAPRAPRKVTTANPARRV